MKTSQSNDLNSRNKIKHSAEPQNKLPQESSFISITEDDAVSVIALSKSKYDRDASPLIVTKTKVADPSLNFYAIPSGSTAADTISPPKAENPSFWHSLHEKPENEER